MYYGVVAPTIHTVYREYTEVKRIITLYPYAKVRSFRTETEAWNFVRRNLNNYELLKLTKYGDTFDEMFVRMEYFIGKDSLFYNYDTSKLGSAIRIVNSKAIIEQTVNSAVVEIPGLSVNPNLIYGHIIAIYHGLDVIGDFVDVDVVVPDHSIFYALNSYTGNNRVLNRVLTRIKSRLGHLSISLPEFGKEDSYDG